MSIPIRRIEMETDPLPRILCVDDEPFVREGIRRLLRRNYEVVGASSGAEGIELLQAGEPFAVIMSDLRMRGMDGVEVLKRARAVAPDTVRLLLTGHADIDAAIHSVNEAMIFRFLTKPCAREQLTGALAAAVEQHRLMTAERVLLERTLHGCIRALSDVLALANPMAFGRASRIQRHAAALAERLDLPDRWQIEVAAMLSQLGMISLPATTLEKLLTGARLETAEEDAVERVPSIADDLLANVPRLEAVREIVRLQNRPFDATRAWDSTRRDVPSPGARILKVVLDYDTLESQGHPPDLALEIMRRRGATYDPAILEAFCEMRGGDSAGFEIRDMPLEAVMPGMTLMADVRTRTGLLLIPKGFEMNAALRERMRSYDPQVLQETVQVLIGAVPELVA